MKKKPSYYVVWNGISPGIYSSWEECKQQVIGVQNARYKGYQTIEEANLAFQKGYIKEKTSKPKRLTLMTSGKPEINSICVDAACSVEKQIMEYRGVFYKTGKVLFHRGPYDGGTNNIGEFLAIVHALALMKKEGIRFTVYTDSMTALAWVRKKNINTKIETGEKVTILLEKAIEWLKNNQYDYSVLKWNTKDWGEIPADFGRK
jgi:ribonuclease HI